MDPKLQKARMQLLLQNPFISYICLQLPLVEREDVGTFATDGEFIYYSPSYLSKLTLEETICVLAEECLHIANLHPLRGQGKDHNIWNQACDQAIGWTLIQAGYKWPADIPLREEFRGLAAEAIYNKLQQEQAQAQQDQDQGQGQGAQSQNQKQAPSPGQVLQSGKKGAELAQLEQNLKQTIVAAMQVAKAAGKMPGDVEQKIKELIESKVNWRETLYKFLDKFANLDYSYQKPNSYYLQQGIILPSLAKPKKVKIALVRDTSGSMTEQMKDVCSECYYALMSYNLGGILIDTDTKVQRVVDLQESSQDEVLTCKGGGGTDFREVMKLLSDEDVNGIIFLTDGETMSWGDDPGVDVLWFIFNTKRITPPFGDVVQIQE